MSKSTKKLHSYLLTQKNSKQTIIINIVRRRLRFKQEARINYNFQAYIQFEIYQIQVNIFNNFARHMELRDSQQTVFEQVQKEQIEQKNIDLKKYSKYWTLYFNTSPPQNFDLNHPLHKVLFLFAHAIEQKFFCDLFQFDENDKFYYETFLDFPKLLHRLNQLQQNQIAEVLREVFSSFAIQADQIIKCLGLVLHSYFIQVKNKKQKKVKLIIKDYPQINIEDIKAHMVQCFVCFQAIVLKVYQTKLMPTSIQFLCHDCKSTFYHYLNDGNYTVPVKCQGTTKKQCKGRTFQQKKDTIKTIFYQRIKVQEIDSDGRVPRQIVCELRQNLVGKVITGETLKMSGIIRTQAIDEKDKKVQGIFTPYLIANSIVQRIQGKTTTYNMETINEMKSDPNIFYSLIKSFCATIFGQQIVKVGILLGMIGGSSKNLLRQSTFRQTSHILLLGDPGLGKSQLLKFAVQLLPHSIYVNATAATSSGLTVTLNKQNNQQFLEAGALLLADNGICAIDQFDKAPDTSSLLQVMEQQTISIAKAGIICQLKCRVGILASANPVYGCYNKGKSFKQNTKISNAILSRFDLIFLLLDKPDPDHDKKLSEHIMKIHNQKRKRAPQQQKIEMEKEQKFTEFLSLRDKYHKITSRHRTKYQISQIKQYLRYVRNQIHPILSRQACEVIKGFYLALRQNNPSNSYQITNRQLQSLIRLSMAKARLQFRNIVNEEDALQICQLMQQSLFDSFQQMGYNINALKQETKKVKVVKRPGQLSLPKQRKMFVQTLSQLSGQRESNIWQWSQLVKIAKDLQLNVGDFFQFIQRLNQDGVLLQKAQRKYQFQDSFL